MSSSWRCSACRAGQAAAGGAGRGRGLGRRVGACVAAARARLTAGVARRQVHVKLSMLGFSVPRWTADPAKEAFLKVATQPPPRAAGQPPFCGSPLARRCERRRQLAGRGALRPDAPSCRLQELVLETIALFGAERCMFSANWHVNGAVSNSDNADGCEISFEQLWERYAALTSALPEADVARLFAGTAESFYRI